MASVLANIRQECADEVAALAFFDDMPVLVEDRKDVESEISRALGMLSGAKSGAFVVFMTAAASVRGSGEFGPVFGEIRMVAHCLENPVLNRGTSGTQKTAWEMAEQVAACLNNFKPASANGPLTMLDPAIEPMVLDLPGGLALPGFAVNFSVSGSLAIVKTQVATPALVQAGATVTMTCATAGAAIFYTTNGKRPNPNNGTLYSTGITPAAGTVLKARGWLSGFLASEIGTLTVE